MMTYKGYLAQITYNDENEFFHGEIVNTRDVITFQGKTVNELKKAFCDSIDDYLEFCEERDETPDRPFSGKFNLRVEPELHREIYIAALRNKKSINEWIKEAITHHLWEK